MKQGLYYDMVFARMFPVKRPTTDNKDRAAEYEEIMQYFNRVAIHSGVLKTAAKLTHSRKHMINGRMSEGYTVADFKRVIYGQFLKWTNDEKMRKYLTVETLFKASNFPKYLEASNVLPNNTKLSTGKSWLD